MSQWISQQFAMYALFFLISTFVVASESMTKHVIFLEGSQGSGKTYLANHLPNNINVDDVIYRIINVPEPYEEWESNGIIDLYKTNFNELTPLFQSAIMSSLTRVLHDALKAALHNDILIVNRSVHGAFHVYFDIFKNPTYVGNELVKFTYKSLDLGIPALYIFMDTLPEVCFERILSRNRADEAATMTMDYIKLQHQRYTNLFQNILPKYEEINIHNESNSDVSVIDAIKMQIRKNLKK